MEGHGNLIYSQLIRSTSNSGDLQLASEVQGRVLGTPTGGWLIRSIGVNLGLQSGSAVEGGLAGLSPLPVGSDALPT